MFYVHMREAPGNPWGPFPTRARAKEFRRYLAHQFPVSGALGVTAISRNPYWPLRKPPTPPTPRTPPCAES